MTITTRQAKELRKRITKLVKAEGVHAFKGSYPPEEAKQIEEELRIAKKRVHECIEMLKLPDGRVRP